MTGVTEIVSCKVCGSLLGVSGAGWRLTHHNDGLHTAIPPEEDQ